MATRSTRWTPSEAQLGMLEACYSINAYPSHDTRTHVAVSLGIEPRQVQVWFQNRRQKAKKLSNAPRCEEDEKSSEKPEQPGSPNDNSASPVAPVGPPVPIPPTSFSEQLAASKTLAAFDPPPSVLSLLRPSPMFLPSAEAPAPAALGEIQPTRNTIDNTVAAAVQQAWCQQQPLSGPPQSNDFCAQIKRRLMMAPRFADLLPRPPRTIEKSRPPLKCWKGYPMSRRSISMDALEVLSSQFSA